MSAFGLLAMTKLIWDSAANSYDAADRMKPPDESHIAPRHGVLTG